jgi:hypothetical protein
MKMKWWRWWIVPLILTILFEFVAADGLLLALKPESSANMFLPFYLQVAQLLCFIYGLFLGLVWPAALILHIVWKRRKTKKGVLAHPEVQPSLKDAL